MEIKCPQCGNSTIFSTENPFRPFCSERCKLIDLGEWASGGYRIPVPGNDSNEQGIEEQIDSENKLSADQESED